MRRYENENENENEARSDHLGFWDSGILDLDLEKKRMRTGGWGRRVRRVRGDEMRCKRQKQRQRQTNGRTDRQIKTEAEKWNTLVRFAGG